MKIVIPHTKRNLREEKHKYSRLYETSLSAKQYNLKVCLQTCVHGMPSYRLDKLSLQAQNQNPNFLQFLSRCSN
jgi:hypothetical protein